MVNIVGIRFPNSAKTYCFEAESVEVKAGDRVVVESELGISIGDVYRTRCEMKSSGKALKPKNVSGSRLLRPRARAEGAFALRPASM